MSDEKPERGWTFSVNIVSNGEQCAEFVTMHIDGQPFEMAPKFARQIAAELVQKAKLAEELAANLPKVSGGEIVGGSMLN